MASFDLDLAVTPPDVARQLEALLDRLHAVWTASRSGSEDVTYTVELRAGGMATVRVRPLPAERLTPLTFGPRALLEAHSETADLDGLRRAIILVFLRAAG